MYTFETRIPKERIAVLIGKDGEIKSNIESAAKVKLDIDSKEGDVVISGEDSISIFTSKEIIRAIGRGFNPELALLLLKQDYSFELINLADFAKTKNDAIRLKGRVIGEAGKSRKTIEELTECSLSVYGKTIGIIGEVSDVAVARRAIEALLSGSPHASVYTFLEKQRRMRRMGQISEKNS